MSCCRTEAQTPAVAAVAAGHVQSPVARPGRGGRAWMGACLAAALALAGCGGGAEDSDAASAYLVARYAGVDGLNGNPWPPARDRLAAAGVTVRSARCVHRLTQDGEVQGDTWAGDPPVWVVVEISSRQLDKARSADAAWATYEPTATKVWAPYQGNAASCPATAG